MIKIKTLEEIEKMRVAGQVVARTLEALERSIVPGMTRTVELDELAEKLLAEEGAKSSFRGYRGYPNTVCIAVNEEVVHGIPGDRIIQSGDIVGIDVGAIVEGYHGDSAITVPVGDVTDEARRLLRVARDALFRGIAKARAGNRLSDISHAVQQHAERHGYSIVRDLVGHGIGSEMHEEPQVPNFGKPGRGPVLEAGMTLAIEPMVNASGYEIESLPDKWTVVTKDRSLSAHFEHTVAVTAKGPDILTLRREETVRR
ncbi:MAG: type I methionyl aminopeptidase [Armatimonadetes bacterium]|nr:type I methionyl aminopeptidase [Armatimonadota bacterium]